MRSEANTCVGSVGMNRAALYCLGRFFGRFKQVPSIENALALRKS